MLLKFAIQQFKEDREFKQIAKATMTNYMGCLKEFHHYCVEREIVDIAEITTSTIKQYLSLVQRIRQEPLKGFLLNKYYHVPQKVVVLIF